MKVEDILTIISNQDKVHIVNHWSGADCEIFESDNIKLEFLESEVKCIIAREENLFLVSID